MKSAAMRFSGVSVSRPRKLSAARNRTSASRSPARIDALPGAGAGSCATTAAATRIAAAVAAAAHRVVIRPLYRRRDARRARKSGPGLPETDAD